VVFAKGFQIVVAPSGAAEMINDVEADRAPAINDVHVARIPHAVERRLDCLLDIHGLTRADYAERARNVNPSSKAVWY